MADATSGYLNKPPVDEREQALFDAALAMLENYVHLVASGDCGFWDPNAEPHVIQLRKALNAYTEIVL